MEDLSDDQLVRKAKQDDLEAFAELARRYQEKIIRMILRLTKNRLDADDLAQETFLQAYKSLKGFKQKSNFYTWIYRIAMNLTLNFLKKSKREKLRQKIEIETLSIELSGCNASSSPEKNSVMNEFRRKIKEAIDSLPLPYRTSFILVEFQGMSHKQAAYVLRCSENTVAWRMHKARKLLQSSLRPFWKRGII